MLRSPNASRFSWLQILNLFLITLLQLANGVTPEILNDEEAYINHRQSALSMYLNVILAAAPGVKLAYMSNGSIITLLIILIYVFSRKKARSLRRHLNFNKNGGKFLKRARSNHAGDREFTLYTPEEIQLATSNFDPKRLLSTLEGKARTMYGAMLADGSTVAVKRANDVSKDLREMFIEEATILTQIDHPNIVPLLGFSLETDHPFLVYKFITGEDLLSKLENARDATSRAWVETKGILRNIADSIYYLHLRSICHRDIRMDNILVDRKSTAYLTNFGLARIEETQGPQILDNATGRLSAYTDPEVWNRKNYTSGSDVYSMGVIMAQLLSGMSLNRDRLIVPKFIKSVKDRSATGVLDPRFDAVRQEAGDELWSFALVACACLRQHGDHRPKMEEVANILWGRIPLPRDYHTIEEHVPHLI